MNLDTGDRIKTTWGKVLEKIEKAQEKNTVKQWKNTSLALFGSNGLEEALVTIDVHFSTIDSLCWVNKKKPSFDESDFRIPF